VNPNLARDELRIWIISLDRLATTCDWELLDDIECRRAERFALGVDRSRFVVAHASLRRILFHHTGIAPQQLQFRNGPQGKPYVDVGERPRPIQFNLAHSGSVAALAVQLQTEVGVDVERIERIRDAAAIARRYFHPDETAWLDERRNEVRNQCFLHQGLRNRPVEVLGFVLHGWHEPSDRTHRQPAFLAVRILRSRSV